MAPSRQACSEEIRAMQDEPSGLWDVLSSRRPLPLRFVLHPSRRPNGALCPCLEVDLPAFELPDSGNEGLKRHNKISRTYKVTRILDPEHKLPYVSLSPILRAAGLSMIQGLLLLSLDPHSDYDSSLAGLEPWDDIWISFKLATRIAHRMGIHPRLSALLDPQTRLAWSLDEGHLGVSHNWIVPAELLDPATYSAEALLTSPGFAKINILKDGEQLKTLVSGHQRQEIKSRAVQNSKSGGRLHEKMMRWSNACYTAWRDVDCARTELIQTQLSAEQSSEERSGTSLTAAQCLLQELDVQSIPPTLCDTQEWIQLSTAALVGLEDRVSPPETALCSLTPTQLTRLKKLDVVLQQRTKQDTSMTIVDEREWLLLLDNLHLQLSAKMGSLHRMQLLSAISCSTNVLSQNAAAVGLAPAIDDWRPPIKPAHSKNKNPDSYSDLLDSIGQIVEHKMHEHTVTHASNVCVDLNKDLQAGIESLHQRLDGLTQHLDTSRQNFHHTGIEPEKSETKGRANLTASQSIPASLQNFFPLRNSASSPTVLLQMVFAMFAYYIIRQIAP